MWREKRGGEGFVELYIFLFSWDAHRGHCVCLSFFLIELRGRRRHDCRVSPLQLSTATDSCRAITAFAHKIRRDLDKGVPCGAGVLRGRVDSGFRFYEFAHLALVAVAGTILL